MKRTIIAAAIGAVALCGAARPASAQIGETDRMIQRQTTAGQAVRIWPYVKLNHRCQQNGTPQISLLTPPAHGSIEQRSEEVAITTVLPGGNDCRGKSAPGIAVWYTPAAGFKGQERFDYQVTYGSLSRHDTIVVDVR